MKVTTGYFDEDGLYDFSGGNDAGDAIDLSGYTGTVQFYATRETGVPRDYEPYGVFESYNTNSITLTLTNGTQSYIFSHGDSNYEPIPGQTYHWVSSSGTPKSGSLYTYFGENAGPTRRFDLSYQKFGKAGSGLVEIGHEDLGLTNYASIHYQVTGGAVSGLVPEPASWALVVGGFGLAGASLRQRRSATRVTYA